MQHARAIHLSHLGLCRLPDGTLNANKSLCSGGATSPETIDLHGRRKLVVCGAHLFGKDHNDPLFRAVKDIPWSTVVLVEASPPIASELNATASRSLTSVATGAVRVLNQGVCPPAVRGSLPFYSIQGYKAAGIPRWLTQIGSFNFSQVEKAFPSLTRKWVTMDRLRKIVRDSAVQVPCGPLDELLSQQDVLDTAVLQLDLEGIDCRVVAAQDWCILRPRLLIFEVKHGEPVELSAAYQKLAQNCSDGYHYERATPSGENAYHLLVKDGA